MTSASWQSGRSHSSVNPRDSARLMDIQGSPAYTAVSARRTLTRPAAAPEAKPKPQPVVKIEWPQPVRDYTSRAFTNCDDMTHVEIAARLRTVITNAAENNQLDSIDWSTYPLPADLIRAERAALYSPPALTPNSSKKRKSTDLESTTPLPPWRQKNTASLAERVSLSVRPNDKRQKRADNFRATAPASKLSDLEKRRQRFDLGNTGPSSPYLPSRDDSPIPDANDGPVVGTCQTLEKNYFRLTAPPKPETVRPLPVLKKTLDLLINKWKENHHYGYICDQFKSLRQDLTVQHIKNEFTVRVYEAHARIALEKGDLGEYNQCQTQLRALYKQRLGGCPGEFLAYRILYTIYTCNRTGMNDVLADLTPADKQFPAVKHALGVRAALATGNYHRFFRLFDESPNMGAYLMDMFINRERLSALSSICRAYKPDVKTSFLTAELAFVDDRACADFLSEYAGGQTFFDKKADDDVRFATGRAGLVYEQAKKNAFRAIDIKGQI